MQTWRSADQHAGDHHDLQHCNGEQSGGMKNVTHDSLLSLFLNSSMLSSCDRLKAPRVPSTQQSRAKLLRDLQRPERRGIFLEA
jgi:hypothetical protein